MNEVMIVQFFNRLGQGTFLDSLTIFISYIPFLILFWVVLALLSLKFDKKNGKVVFAAVLIAIALHFTISEGLLKHAILTLYPMRIRPYISHPGEITGLGYLFTDSSFPSSHMASTLAVLTVFFSYYKKYWPLILLFVLFMAFARMHMGMHYPTDVLAGTLLGIGYGTLGIYIAKKIFNKKKKKK